MYCASLETCHGTCILLLSRWSDCFCYSSHLYVALDKSVCYMIKCKFSYFILFYPPHTHTHTLICKIYLLVLLIFQNSGDANQSVAFKLEQLTSLIYSIEEKVSLFFVYGWQQTWQYSNWKLYCRLTSHLIYRPRMLCLKLWDMMEGTESHLFLLWYLK